MQPTLRRVLRCSFALALFAMGLVVFSAQASGASTTAWTSTVPIEFSNSRIVLGSATLTRVDGSEADTLIVDFEIPGGYQESHLCVSSTAFTDREPPGSCAYSLPGSSTGIGHYEISIDPLDPVYVQLHFVAQGETGYVGWQPGTPFYGNLVVPGSEEPPPFTCEGDSEPMTDVNGDGSINQADCGYVPPFTCEGDSEPMTDVNGDGSINQADCGYVPPFTCEGDSEPMTDVNGDGSINQADCGYVPPFTCEGDSEPMTDVNGDGSIDQADCGYVPPFTCEGDSEPMTDVNGDGSIQIRRTVRVCAAVHL